MSSSSLEQGEEESDPSYMEMLMQQLSQGMGEASTIQSMAGRFDVGTNEILERLVEEAREEQRRGSASVSDLLEGKITTRRSWMNQEDEPEMAEEPTDREVEERARECREQRMRAVFASGEASRPFPRS